MLAKIKGIIKPACPWLFLILLPLFLAGCWDRKELEDQAFIQTMGIDRGKDHMLLITFRIAIPSKAGLQSGGGGASPGSQAEQSSLLTSVIAPTIPAALNLASGYIDRQLTLMHLKAVVFGEDFAREGVMPVASFLARNRETRRSIFVGVSEGTAYKFLEGNKPDLEKTYAKWWEGIKLMENAQAIHPGTMFHNLIQDMQISGKQSEIMYFALNKNTKKDPSKDIQVPKPFQQGTLDVKAGEIPRTGGNEVDFIGAAVFKGDKFIETLTLRENLIAMMLRGNFQNSYYTIADPNVKNRFLSLEISEGSQPSISVSLQNNKIVIHEKLSLEGDLIDIQGKYNYASQISHLKELDRLIAKNIKKEGETVFNKFKEKKIDLIGYGEYAQRDFLTLDEWMAFNWAQKIKNAQLNLEVTFSTRRTGMAGKQPVPQD